ncbi:nucleotide sugar dehydrogenase [Microbacterium sp. X-17]|uniref:nucleotide sugar dehydrogenase n=1 Tax=Microbacterium sp. X-17 TaxID=3144404 RepID=UPI0031F493A7
MTTLDPRPPAPSLLLPEAALPEDSLGLFDYDVAIVGLGYVGLPTALAYHAAGTRVLALDVSAARLRTIRSQNADLLPNDRERLRAALRDPGFALTGDVSRLSSAAAVVVCVPTPVDAHLVPDLHLIAGACRTVVEHAVPGQLLMLTSTTYVGCTKDLLVDPLIERGFVPGENIHVAFSAERIDPGNDAVAHDDVPRVVGGATDACEERAEELLLQYAASVHRVHGLGAAEMTKLLENTFRAVNIALANEFADICRALDIPVTDVIDAAATKPYGFMRFLPGPGVGGHCIPCDPHYLLWQLKARRVPAPMITQAMEEIAHRPRRVVDRARDILSDLGRGLGGTRVLVVGVTYKPDVADLRESPALEILDSLADAGATVGFVDPFVDAVRLPSGRMLHAERSAEAYGAGLVILHTPHRDLDLSWLGDDQLVLDATYRATGVSRLAVL